MRVSRDKARENREKVVEASSNLFRERGVSGVAIGELMAEVGLTHGGFYKQFSSKADLVEEACAAALQNTLRFWDTYLSGDDDARARFITAYLSPRHRDDVATGCLLPALAGEARREPAPVRDIFVQAIEAYARRLDGPEALRTPESRERALAILAGLVGALVLARASNSAELSDEILEAGRKQALRLVEDAAELS